jgi:phosphatidylglycerophosphatase C
LKQIAFFDFDGTITTKDTFLEFIKHEKGNFRFYAGFLLNSPFLFAYKAGIISNQLAKERILKHFFRKTNGSTFQQRCDAFAAVAIPALVRPKAMHEINKLKEAGVEVVIVSASAENWISHWCRTNNLSLIATRLEQSSECITGAIVGKNCHGEEKVRRIREQYNLADYSKIYCYGDTSGDKPMLALGTNSFYKPFR